MTYPLVLELADDGIPVTLTLRGASFLDLALLPLAATPLFRPRPRERRLTNELVDAHRDDPQFGYRFLTDELEARGHRASERRVWRLCSNQQLFSSLPKRCTYRRRAGVSFHDDLVRRDFTASRPNELWFTDITEHRTQEGTLYCCSIDERDRAAPSPRDDLSLGPRQPVPSERPSSGCSRHTGSGLDGQGRRRPGQRVASMESSHSLLQNNVLDTRRWATREELHLAIVEWIERIYHRRRRKRRLGKMTPVEFEVVYGDRLESFNAA